MRMRMVVLLGFTGWGFALPLLAEETISEARYNQVLAELTPSAEEPWRTIPWELDVLEAQRLAASQNKPIFIWAMDGHPLGCT